MGGSSPPLDPESASHRSVNLGISSGWFTSWTALRLGGAHNFSPVEGGGEAHASLSGANQPCASSQTSHPPPPPSRERGCVPFPGDPESALPERVVTKWS